MSSQVVRNFVSTELGSHYIVSPDFDLVGCFKEICDRVEPSLWAGAGCVFSIKGIQMEYLHTTDHVHSLSPEIRVKHRNKNACLHLTCYMCFGMTSTLVFATDAGNQQPEHVLLAGLQENHAFDLCVVGSLRRERERERDRW